MGQSFTFLRSTMYINTRVFGRRKVPLAELVFAIIVFILVLRFLEPKVNIKSLTSGRMEALKGYEYPKRVEDEVSWGNFEPTEGPARAGPGEGGKPHILAPGQASEANQSISTYGMNAACSNEISLDRSVPDLRHEDCKHWNYPENLPKVSVVVVFHNEAFSVLMRTIHSIMNRTPPQLLEEVLLIDDFSEMVDLKGSLASYILRWRDKVRLIRNQQREGLINTKSRGAREARGEIIVFLDAHCEVGKNWLPPLITPIYNNRTTLTSPIVDKIDFDHFGISREHMGVNHWRGIFEWGLEYRQGLMPAKELRGRSYLTEPYRSPAHAGGLFAINRNYFLELGLYDPGLLLWGGENFELSFKVWQCGGSILFVPCSRVGHVSKKIYTFKAGDLGKKRKGPHLILSNYKRVVETWMDEKFRKYFYRRQPQARSVEMGDISEQLKLKEKLQCKSFQWYMDNVAYDVLIWFKEPPPNQHWGYLKNNGTDSCLGSDGPVPAGMVTGSCDTIVRLNFQGQLGIGQFCVLYINNELKNAECTMFKVDGPWEYNDNTRVMHHKEERKCMAAGREKNGNVSLLPCDPTNAYQQWSFFEKSQEHQ